MERGRFAAVALAAGIGLFGAAIAAREVWNPWWTNAAVGVVVTVVCAAILRARWSALLEVRGRSLAGAVLLGGALVALTHLSFALAVELIPGLETSVVELYGDIEAQSPGPIASLGLIAIVVVAEEVLWRGLAVELLTPRLSGVATGCVVVALYAVPQLIGGDWVLLAAAVGLGGVLTAQRLLTKGLLEPIATHAIWSACIFSLLPLA